MKILYLVNYYQEPGGENLWGASEASLMSGRGHETIAYTRTNTEIRDFNLLQKTGLVFRTTWAHDSWKAIRRLIREHRPDIVHSFNQHVMISPSAYYACKAEGVPVLQTIYNYRLVCPGATLYRNGAVCTQCRDRSLLASVAHGCFRASRAQTAVLATSLQVHRIAGTWRKAVSGYIVPSRFMGSKLMELGISPDRIHFKPNYHEPDPGPRQAPQDFALYIGRLTVEKGVRTLLNAWRSNQQLPRLIIAGGGPLEPECRALAAAHPGKVTFLGQVTHDRVIELTKSAICLLVPSEWLEGFPHVLLESLGCGVPLVASRIGTLAEVIEHERNGLLFEPGSPAALAAAVQRLTGSPSFASECGRRARQDYLDKYTAQKNYEILLGIYETILSRNRVKTPALEMAVSRTN
jgi:glycosyltransferase involved in cell wall biosynthesis